MATQFNELGCCPASAIPFKELTIYFNSHQLRRGVTIRTVGIFEQGEPGIVIQCIACAAIDHLCH